ncbi:MAG: CDP-alcohol phosphatidyltransferase family protein [Turicibacter sp.]|nr:CDP-alcohol phosphatidyltransferase family protein [Turicibacter sp.]
MVKYVPNVLSISRIILCLPLLFLEPFTFTFMVLYVVAGLTDMVDGPIARRTKSTSQLGASLDSAADFLFALVVLFRIIPLLNFLPVFLVWIGVILAIRALALFVGFVRHGQLIMLHTYLNKIAAFALFLFPLLYIGMNINLLLLILCIIVSLAFVEELLINYFSKLPDRDVKGIFFSKKAT